MLCIHPNNKTYNLIDIFIEHPLLLLFVVASLGYLAGTIKIKGSSLGVAAVLFVGLLIGTLDARLVIPEIVFSLGLVLFVYSIGLSSGPAFFQSYKTNGFRDIGFILSMLLISGCVAGLLWYIFDFSAATITGVYAGSTTNTPALAGVIEYASQGAGSMLQTDLKSLVVGYSFSYPMGVLGGIIAIAVMQKWLAIDYQKEKKELKHKYPIEEELTSCTVRISNEDVVGHTLRDLLKKHKWNIVFGRHERERVLNLAKWDTTLLLRDRIMIVGSQEELDAAIAVLGVKSTKDLTTDREEFDIRQIFVSNGYAAGRTIASLNLDEKYDAVITRIRRGDADILAKGNTILELGDRIRFVARRKDLNELSKYFGDSYRDSSKVNLFSFGLGIGMGLLLGMFEFRFSDTLSFKLGYAGGPLIVSLLLGALRRTGPVVWTLPYSATVTLQQMGLMLLLAVIGVKSGTSFINSFNMDGVMMIAASGIISLSTAFLILLVGYKVVKIPFSILTGMVSNQPAILDFALSKTGNRLPLIGYTMMFPIALISKIVIAQIMFIVLS